MRRRIQKHLKAAGLFERETLHSFRRSAVQHAADMEGYDVKRLMEIGRIQSYAAFWLYVHGGDGASIFKEGTANCLCHARGGSFLD